MKFLDAIFAKAYVANCSEILDAPFLQKQRSAIFRRSFFCKSIGLQFFLKGAILIMQSAIFAIGTF